MARKTKKHKFAWISILVLVAAVAGGFSLLNQNSRPFRTIPALPVASYTDNALAYQGNLYRLQGKIDTQILWDEASGRMISLQTDEGPIAVLFPQSVTATSLERGQKIVASAVVGDKGVLIVRAFQKE